MKRDSDCSHISLCTGKTPAGNDFQYSFPKFDEVIFAGFQDFIRAVFRKFVLSLGTAKD
jgi:hypothetical protein